MSQKGSSYRRKHTVEVYDREAEEEKEIEQKPYMAVLYHDYGYIDDFLNLSVEDAGRAYELLSRSAKDDMKDAYKLDAILAATGFRIAEHDGNYLHKQELLTIRMDFYGTIDRIKKGLRSRELSPYYQDLMANPLRKRPKSEAYDFASSPSWKLFSRFHSFRHIEKNLKAYLIRRKINPQILQLMTPRDFSDLVVQSFQRRPEEQTVTFETDITVRNEFVQDLVRRQGDEMTDMLLKQGWDERYVHSMINMMRNYGKSNSSKLVITELNFTPRVLSDLRKAEAEFATKMKSISKTNSDYFECKFLLGLMNKIKEQNFKAGDPIPQEVIDALLELNKGELIVARDKNGRKLQGSDFPSFDVHHKHAVSDAGDLKSVAYVNYKNNLCLVRSDIHSLFIHRCDRVRQKGETKSYSKRLEFLDPNTAFMIGFNPSERLSYDFERAKPSKRMKMDDRHIVDYEACMKQLASNQAAYDRLHHKFDLNMDFQHYNSHRKVNKKRHMYLKARTR